MAFSKIIPIGNGFDATYWKIGILFANFTTEQAWCHMHGYKDQASAVANLSPAMTIEHNLPFVPDATRTQIYNYLKANLPEWAGAQDV